MQIDPTPSSRELALAGLAVTALGAVLRLPFVVGYGAALLLGVAIARTVTQVGVARVRAAGFEMLWTETQRARRVARGGTLELRAEIRNRDSRAARYGNLRVVASPDLDVTVEPADAEVPAFGRLSVSVKVRAPRVGRHGVHGLSLEVLGSPGLFEVPLTFANPQAIEVLPGPFAPHLRSARGGRSRMSAPEGRHGPLAGEGVELRELREHQPGDPFKRIAWKASARRGKLLVRENELEQRDVVWLFIDASLEHWAGPPGQAPLDTALDEAASLIEHHLARGDRVGLGLLGARKLCWLLPDRGPRHAAALISALAFDAGCMDSDRSDWDEAELAQVVIEHLRPLDPSSVAALPPGDLDRVASCAQRWLRKAPLAPPRPRGATSRERLLRQYLLAFGIQSPPRDFVERPHSELLLAKALRQLARERKRPSILYVWAAAPDPSGSAQLLEALQAYPKRHTELRWCLLRQHPHLSNPSPRAQLVSDAILQRIEVARRVGLRELARCGVRVVEPRPTRASVSRSAAAQSAAAPDR